ncbi:MAG: hypothetical protein ACFUZC_09405 [Chthoniobacteraceae bacterium]
MPSLVLAPSRPIVSTPARRRVWRGLASIVLFLAGAFGTGAVLNALLPFPPVPAVKEKLEWLERHGDEYDTFFIGTSRTNCHVVPAIFDEMMAQAGYPTHSFNLGINGMRSPEDSFVLETALKRRSALLKLVVVEANAIPMEAETNAHGTQRAEYWRDPRRFWAVSKSVIQARMRRGLWHKVESFRYNLDVFLSRSFCLGRARQALEGRFAPPPDTSRGILGRRYDGSYWYDAPLVNISDEEWTDFEHRLTQPFKAKEADRASQDQLSYKRGLIEKFGGEMITFSPPMPGMGIFTPRAGICPPSRYFNFALSAQYPELFQRENRADAGHLNRLGAEQFTRRLAERVIAAKRAEVAGR